MVRREVRHLRTMQDVDAVTVLVVTVQQDDGMTWSAEAVDRAVERDGGRFRRARLGVRNDSVLSELDALGIGRGALSRLAAAAGVTPPRRLLRAATLVLGVLAVALAVIAVLAAPVLLAAAAVAAAAAAAVYATGVWARQRPQAMDALFAHIEHASEQVPDAYDALVDALARRIGPAARDRCTIVNRLEGLDDLSGAAIHTYFASQLTSAHGRQLWIVFESAPTAELARVFLDRHHPLARAATGRRGTGYPGPLHRALQADQLALPPEARSSLAKEVGHPERAGYSEVGLIVGDAEPDAGADGAIRFFDGYRRDHPADPALPDALELCHLLGVTTLTRGHVHFSRSTIDNTLVSHTSERGRWDVLRRALPGNSLSQTEMGTLLEELEQRFKIVMEPQPDRWYAVEPSAARALASRHEAYDLADPGLCHLFWALYWYDFKRDSENPFWLHKINGHLLGAAADPGLSDELFAMYVRMARSSLGRSLFGDVPALLERAADLLEPGPDLVSRTDQLRALAWRAYALLGSEAVLRVILRLDRSAARRRTVPDPLQRVFADALTVGGAGARWRDELRDALPGLDPSTDSYARVRASWFALTWSLGARGDEFLWNDVIDAIADDLPTLVRDAVERLEKDLHARVAVDVATVSIGCWSLALATRYRKVSVSEAVDVLEGVYYLSRDLRERYERLVETSGDYDAALDGLAEDLLVSAGAAAGTLESGVPDEARVLNDLVSLAAEAGGRRRKAEGHAAAIERRMGLVQFMWARLGFEQLRAFMVLRRAQYQALSRADGSLRRSHDDVLDTLGALRDRNDDLGLLAHATAAMSAHDAEVTAARHLVGALDRALAGDIGEDLGVELSLLALCCASGFRLRSERVLDYLLVDAGAGTRLARRLEQIAEDDMASVALWLLNAARGAPDQAAAVFAAVKARHATIKDDDEAEKTLQQIDVFELEQKLRANGSADVASSAVRAWRDRCDGSQYAWILHLVLDSGMADTDALTAGAALLERIEYDGRSTAPLHLAVDLLGGLRGPAATELEPDEVKSAILSAAGFLNQWHPVWEPRLPPERNIEICRLLAGHDAPRKATHLARAGHWEAIRQREQLEQRLMMLRAEQRWFAILWHYFDTLEWWGLQAGPDAAIAALFERSPEEHRRFVVDRPGDEPCPPALLARPRVTLSAEFLAVGFAVFYVPLLSGAGFDDVRRAVDDAAQGALDPVIEHAAQMPTLPPEVQTVLRRHRRELEVAAVERV